jgi:hypothetical protein
MLYIRVKKDGTIYDWNRFLAENPECEVVTEEQAYPERFIPPSIKGKPSKVNVATAGIVKPTRKIPEASSGWPT